MENQGVLLNVTSQNAIEIWDVDKQEMAHIYHCKALTAFTVLQGSCFMYIGDVKGNVSVLQFDQESNKILYMQYSIPASVTLGNIAEVSQDHSIFCILPQPPNKFSRVLIIFRNGLLVLWGTQESKVLAIGGHDDIQYKNKDHEKEKHVSSACWACSNGSRIAVGYNDGDIWLWSIPTMSKSMSNSDSKGFESCCQPLPISKLPLSNSKRKMPISSLKWHLGSDNCGHLYVNEGVDSTSSNVIRVISLQEAGIAGNQTNLCELELVLPEMVMEMLLLSSTHEKGNSSGVTLLVLTQSGNLYVYDDNEIEKRLLDAKCKSVLALPKPILIKPPFAESSVTVSKLVTIPNYIDSSNALLQIPTVLKRLFPSTLPMDTKQSAVENSPTQTKGVAKIRTLYITGHINGTINMWDASSPLMHLLLTIQSRSDVEATIKGCAVTAMDFCPVSCLLAIGDQLGMVQIYKIAPENKKVKSHQSKGSNHRENSHDFTNEIEKLGVFKVHKSRICCISLDKSSTRVAAGCQEGLVSVMDTKSSSVLSNKYYFSGPPPNICSLQFENCVHLGTKKSILFVAAKDASVIAVNGDTGDSVSSSILQPKNPSTAIFMHVIEPGVIAGTGSTDEQSGHFEQNNGSHTHTIQSFLLVCSENSVWLYSTSAIIQGIKKAYLKEKFQITCIWASTFQNSSYGFGLVLLYTTGKIEIRSLPDLSILKETTLGICFSSHLKPNTGLTNSLSCSPSGRLVMIDGDKELFHVSLLNDDNDFRLFRSMVHVYNKDVQVSLDLPRVHLPHTPKKKSIVGALINVRRSKPKHSSPNEDQDCGTPIGASELSSIFSIHNFSTSAASSDEKPISDLDDEELDIDDLEIEDHDKSFKYEPTGASKNSSLVKKICKKIKGKKKLKDDRTTSKTTKEDEKDINRIRTVTEIYSAYGHSHLKEPTIHEKTKEKLLENQMKLKAINQRATEMGENAENFQSMAEEILKQVKAKKV